MSTEAKRVIPDERQIRDLILEHAKRDAISVERIEIGRDSSTFKAVTETSAFFIRCGGKRRNYDVEEAVLHRVLDAGMKAPKPVASDVSKSKYPFRYLILEEVPGSPLEEIPKNRWPPLLEQAGKELVQMYSIDLPGFGNLDPEIFRKSAKLVGKHRSWYEALHSTHLKRARALEKDSEKTGFKNSRLSPPQLANLIEVVDRLDVMREKVETLRGKLDIDHGKLIHKDIHADHIFVKDGKVTGVIDFNNASSGDPLYDIATFSLMKGGNLYPHLLKGSQVVFDKKLFHLYRLLHAVGKIHFRYEEGYLNTSPAVLVIALEELSR
ncbi:aminoglycoside phosphotransferase family protein [Patescibacteria group bacterium]|nr:aminoglycoside phosphotransferase family protein [Patescibacteria group bacterium]